MYAKLLQNFISEFCFHCKSRKCYINNLRVVRCVNVCLLEARQNGAIKKLKLSMLFTFSSFRNMCHLPQLQFCFVTSKHHIREANLFLSKNF